MGFAKLNPEEIAVGALLQAPLYFMLGLWVVPYALVCGLLWAYGGSDGAGKLWRRLGVSAMAYLVIQLDSFSWLSFFAAPFTYYAVSAGYGKNSVIWQFFRNRLDHDEADFCTRTILYCIYLLSLVLAVYL